jgi:hypothetical protein
MPSKTEEKVVVQWLTGCVKLKGKPDARAAMQKLRSWRSLAGRTLCRYLFNKLKERSGKCSQQPIGGANLAGLMKQEASLITCEADIPRRFCRD